MKERLYSNGTTSKKFRNDRVESLGRTETSIRKKDAKSTHGILDTVNSRAILDGELNVKKVVYDWKELILI